MALYPSRARSNEALGRIEQLQRFRVGDRTSAMDHSSPSTSRSGQLDQSIVTQKSRTVRIISNNRQYDPRRRLEPSRRTELRIGKGQYQLGNSTVTSKGSGVCVR